MIRGLYFKQHKKLLIGEKHECDNQFMFQKADTGCPQEMNCREVNKMAVGRLKA